MTVRVDAALRAPEYPAVGPGHRPPVEPTPASTLSPARRQIRSPFRRPHGDYDSTGLPLPVRLDLKLPRVGGLEVLRRIRAEVRTRRIPVVILTSSNEEHDLDCGDGRGSNSSIRKPVDFSDFVETITPLGPYWLVINEPPPQR